MMFTTEDKLREVERELKMRRRLYPHWIEIGKIDASDAKRRIDILAAIAAALLEWRDARAAFLRCVDTVPHEDQGIPADLSRRFVDAEEKLFEVANEILML
jgi:hypothetical protein